jgi:hypothetical protein
MHKLRCIMHYFDRVTQSSELCLINLQLQSDAIFSANWHAHLSALLSRNCTRLVCITTIAQQCACIVDGHNRRRWHWHAAGVSSSFLLLIHLFIGRFCQWIRRRWCIIVWMCTRGDSICYLSWIANRMSIGRTDERSWMYCDCWRRTILELSWLFGYISLAFGSSRYDSEVV